MNSAETALATVLLVAQRGRLTVSELAASLEIAPATAYRALRSCHNLGFVRQDVRGGPYVVGPALHDLDLVGSSARSLRDAADSVIGELREQVSETVGVMVAEGRSVRLVQALVGPYEHRVNARVGRVFPAHRTAGGKALLSMVSEGRLDHLYPKREVPPLVDGSQVSWAQFQRELALSRRRGWAYSSGASDPAVAAVAAPIVIASGDPVAAITIAAPISRLGTRVEAEAMAEALVLAASRVQSRMRGGG